VGFGIKLSTEDIAEIEGIRYVAMATNFGTRVASWQRVTDND